MEAPLISVGYAHHKDYHGGAFTLQDIKMDTDPELLQKVEFLCVDQTPDPDPHGKEIGGLFRGFAASGTAGAQYIPFTEKVGTSYARAELFKRARGRVVVCMDCHVLLQRGWIEKLLAYFEDPAHAKDIVSGPILTDAIRQWNDPKRRYSVMATHYADHWRSEMWGTWASTWACPCGWTFSTWKDGNLVRYEHVVMDPKFVKACPKCAKKLPMLDWYGHDQALEKAGYVNLGTDGTDPFEISGQGLGMFAMLKESFPQLPEGLWGFGAEELSLHSLVRHLGGRAVCHPECRWWHRFPRPEPSTYPNTHWYKCRNYVIWFNHLRQLTGDAARWDLEIVRKHFVDVEKVVPQHEWEAMVADPMGRVHGPTEQYKEPVMVNGQPQAYYKRTLEEVYEHHRNIKRDLEQHFPLMRELASNCDHVTLFGKRKEADIAFAMGLVDRHLAQRDTVPRMVSHNLEKDTVLLELDALLMGLPNVRANTPHLVEYHRDDKDSIQVPALDEETDALWIDTVHHADRLRGELAKYLPKVRRYVFLRGTGNFGNEAEGGGPGLYEPARELCNAEGSPWFVCYHTPAEYGLTVLSRNEEDRPPTPIIPWPPGFGPGTELRKMLASIGVHQIPGCDCLSKMIEMDVLGVEGCRAKQDDLAKYLKDNAPRWGWEGILNAAVWTVLTGMVFRINPTDPFPSLIKEAIRRAEADAKHRAKK